jgi:hypothetical protein
MLLPGSKSDHAEAGEWSEQLAIFGLEYSTIVNRTGRFNSGLIHNYHTKIL